LLLSFIIPLRGVPFLGHLYMISLGGEETSDFVAVGHQPEEEAG
jgi:hypothetical protein